MNLREMILNAEDLKREVVTIPEWGDAKITLKAITAKQRAEIVSKSDGKNGATYQALFLVASAHDEEGKPVFTDADLDKLMAKSSSVIERLTVILMKLNGIGTDAQDSIEKN